MKQAKLPESKCPDCLYIGTHQGFHLAVCSKLAVNKQYPFGVLALLYASWREATPEEETWVKRKVPQYFTETGLSKTYFAMKKLLQ